MFVAQQPEAEFLPKELLQQQDALRSYGQDTLCVRGLPLVAFPFISELDASLKQHYIIQKAF